MLSAWMRLVRVVAAEIAMFTVPWLVFVVAAGADRRGRQEADPADPAGPLAGSEDLAWLAVAAIAGGAALQVGLRGARLAPSWAWLVVLVAPPVWGVDREAGAAVAIAGCVALASGVWWRREDVQRGGEAARRARDRLGPRAVLRRRLTGSPSKRDRVIRDRLLLGQTPSGRRVSIPFGRTDGRRGLIVGAPGAGKTVTMSAVAAAYVERGLPVVCLDPKGDPSLRDALAAAADDGGRALFEWSHEGPAIYNPFGRGDATEIADKALAGESWSEPHYLRQAQRYLGWATRVLREAGDVVRLDSLVSLMDPDRLEDVGSRCGPETAQQLDRYLNSLATRQRQDLGGVRDRLAILAESQFGGYLDPTSGGAVIDLGATWRTGAVVYFRLDADRYPLASQMLGAAIVSDLVALTGERQRDRAAGLVAIDEFAAVGASQILRMLSRSRSAGISVVVATQGLADLEDIAGTDGGNFAARVLSQVDFTVAHRQPDPAAAERLSKLCGTRVVWSVNERVRSPLRDPFQAREGMRTRVHEFVRHPGEFKRLGVGEAIVIEPAGPEEASLVHVWPRVSGASSAAVIDWPNAHKGVPSVKVRGGSRLDSIGRAPEEHL